MLNLINVNGDVIKVEVIRYFNLNGNRYFIYSMNETDENAGQVYVKLYAVKIDENMRSLNIVDESEWNSVKDYIKVIIKGNKEGNLVIEDLNYNELETLPVADSRIFKLSSQLTDLLKANQRDFSQINTIPTVETMVQTPTEQSITEIEPITVDKIEEPVVENENIVFPTIENDLQNNPEPINNPVVTDINISPEPVVSTQFNEPMANQEIVAPVANNEPVHAEVQIEPVVTEDYKMLYMEMQQSNEVLKNEIEALKEKINKVTQILGN